MFTPSCPSSHHSTYVPPAEDGHCYLNQAPVNNYCTHPTTHIPQRHHSSDLLRGSTTIEARDLWRGSKQGCLPTVMLGTLRCLLPSGAKPEKWRVVGSPQAGWMSHSFVGAEEK
jgi:hypothetical protein